MKCIWDRHVASATFPARWLYLPPRGGFTGVRVSVGAMGHQLPHIRGFSNCWGQLRYGMVAMGGEDAGLGVECRIPRTL